MPTPFLLQDALIKELKDLFSDYKFKNSAGEPVKLKIYPQSLPGKTRKDDPKHFPYIIVRVLDGETTSETDAATCKIALIVGVRDEDPQYQGYKDVLNILSDLEQHLFSKRVIDDRYVIQHPYDWTLHSEDTYPVYYGGAQTTWMLPGIRQEVML